MLGGSVMSHGFGTYVVVMQAQRECEEIVAQAEAHEAAVQQLQRDAAAAEERRDQAHVRTARCATRTWPQKHVQAAPARPELLR